MSDSPVRPDLERPISPHPLLCIACESCGATLPFDPDRAEVTCSFCAATSTVPEALRSRARAHLAAIEAAWAKEIHARYVALLHDHAARTNPRTMRWMLVLLVAGPLWLIALGSGFAERVHPVFTLICVALTVVAAARVFGGITGPARPFSISLVVVSGLGACPRCGGPMRVWEGSASTSCEYCRASLVVDEPQRRALLEAALARVAPAGAASFEAVERNFRSLRGASSVFGLFGDADLASVMLIATIVLLVGVAGLGFVLFHGAPPVHGDGWVAPALVLGLVAVAVHQVRKVRRLMRARHELEAIRRNPVRRSP
jgi:hypothetical protein